MTNNNCERYPISPLQEGMLFHSLVTADSGIDVQQIIGTVHEQLDSDAFQWAWTQVVQRHPVLRTHFEWQNVSEPRQIVLPTAQVDVTYLDWIDIASTEQIASLQRYLHTDRLAGFNLAQVPLMRLAIIKCAVHKYTFIWTFHHILLDGRTFPLILEEVFALYDASQEQQGELELSVPRPYRDYISWLADKNWEHDELFWRPHLFGITAATPLDVAQAPREDQQPIHDEPVAARLSASATSRLRCTAIEQGLSMNTLFEGAWGLLLARYSDSDDIIYGVTRSCRHSSIDGAEAMVGLLINTVPMRAHISPQTTVIDYLRHLRSLHRQMRDHIHCPLHKIQSWSEVSHDSVLFDSLLVFENYHLNAHMQAKGGRWANIEFEYRGHTNYPLTIAGYDDDELLLQVDFDGSRFSRESVERIAGHLCTVLEHIPGNLTMAAGELPILTDAERHQLLVAWNYTQREYPSEQGIHALFEQQVTRRPGSLALRVEGASLTYAELDSRANQLAHYLRRHGIGPDELVGVCMQRSVNMMVGLIATLKTGAAYVPMEPSFPAQRLACVAQDASVRWLLTDQEMMTRLPDLQAECICLDDPECQHAVSAMPLTGLAGTVLPDQLAYVIYTSGSTGQPKGVAVAHRQILNYVHGLCERLAIQSGWNFASVSTIATDLGNTALFAPWYTGGCLHLITRERAADAAALADYCVRYPIDCLKIVPSHLSALVQGPSPHKLMPRHRLILGGEAARCDWVETLRGLAPDCVIYNHYGPTEATIGALTYLVSNVTSRRAVGNVPLGRPLPNIRVYLLDSRQQPVPIGVPGELYISGEGIARGYWKRQEWTAERFLADPFSRRPDTRMYRTGDRVRYTVTGDIEFLGRVDEQVKIRGFRVEPAEITALLGQCPLVREATVVAYPGASGDMQLAAYVVPQQGTAETVLGPSAYQLPNKLMVAHLNRNETDYIYREIFELQAYLRHGITIEDDNIIFDVGSNIGLFTVFANQVCRHPRIYAFEPNPTVFELACANMKAYSEGGKVFNHGLSKTETSADFTFFEGFSLLSGFYADTETEKSVVRAFVRNQQQGASGDAGELSEQIDELLNHRFQARTLTTRLRTLSDVMAEEGIERIDLLKINAEKSEWDVLQGIRDEDWGRIRQIVLEVDVSEYLPRIMALLEQHGFACAVEQDAALDGTELCYVYAIRASASNQLILEQAPGAHLRDIAVPTGPLLMQRDLEYELRNDLQHMLPQYMMPSTFVTLTAMPLTPSGKIDRRALPVPGESLAGLETSFVAPRTSIEESLAAIWQEVLGSGPVGIHDNFFELGGHSLLVIRANSRVSKRFQVDLPLQSFFETPTVGELAAKIDALQACGAASMAPKITRLAREGRRVKRLKP